MQRRRFHAFLVLVSLIGLSLFGLAAPASATWPGTITVDKKINNQDTFTGLTGDIVTVTITGYSSGPDPAGHQHMQISDILPTCLSYVQGSATPAPLTAPGMGNGGTITWPDTEVNHGDSYTVSFKAKLGAPGNCVNKGRIVSETEDKYDTVPITINPAPKPDLSMDKDCTPDEVAPGGTATCTLTIHNHGTADAVGSTVEDVLDPGLTYEPGSTTGAAEPTVVGQTLTWNIGTVGAGLDKVITYRQKVPDTGPPGPAQFSDTATAITPGDPNGGNNKDTETTKVTYPPDTSKTVDVYVVKSAPATANPGDVITHTLSFGNLGNDTATGVKLTDTIGPGMTFQPGSVTAVLDGASFNPNTQQAGQQLTFTVGSVGAGKTGTITYQVKVDPTADTAGVKELTDTVVITTTSTNTTNPENDKSTAVTKVDYQPKLFLDKDGCRKTVVSGGVQTYRLSFKNTGSAPAVGVKLSDTVPPEQDIIPQPGMDVNGQTVSWEIGTLNPGQEGFREFSVIVNAPNGSTVSNTATLSADNAASTSDTSQTAVTNSASTKGMAYELDVRGKLLGINIVLANQLVKSSSAAPGGPTDSAAGPVLSVTVPSIASLGVLSSASHSEVGIGQASTTATSQVAGVNLLGGLIKANTVRAVSQSVAGPQGASTNFNGSTFQDLIVGGQSLTNVAPNTPVVVKNALGVVVAEGLLNEQTKTAALVNGNYTTSGSVNMIRLTLKVALGGLGVGASVIVGHAESSAQYPSGLACGAVSNTVSAKAFTAFVNAPWLGIESIYVSRAEITPLGGSDSADIPVMVPGLVSSNTTQNLASGSIGSPPNAAASSKTEKLNVLNGLVTADVVQVGSTSSANGATADTQFTSTFLNLKINGTPVVDLPVPANTIINIPQPGGGLISIILNEQIENGDGTKNTEGTINAVHVYVFKGSILQTEVVAVSAHSDAHVGS